MPRRSVVAVLMVLHVAAPARADGALPGGRRVEQRMQFDNLDEFPEYDFYLKFGGEAFTLGVQMLNAGLAVTFPRNAYFDADLWLIGLPAGTPAPAFVRGKPWEVSSLRGARSVRMDIPQPHSYSSVFDPVDHVVWHYRVALRDGELVAELSRRDRPLDWPRVVFIGTALSVVIALFGLRVASGKGRPSAWLIGSLAVALLWLMTIWFR